MTFIFESAVMILAFINVGKYLEARSKGKTSEAIRKLMDMAPKTAVVERDGRQIEIPAEEAVAGDIFIVKPGSSIPADGIIIEGSTAWMRLRSQGRAFRGEERGRYRDSSDHEQGGIYPFPGNKGRG